MVFRRFKKAELEKQIEKKALEYSEMTPLERFFYFLSIALAIFLFIIIGGLIYLIFSTDNIMRIECKGSAIKENTLNCDIPHDHTETLSVLLQGILLLYVIFLFVALQKISSKLSLLLLEEHIVSLEEKAVKKNITNANIKTLGDI